MKSKLYAYRSNPEKSKQPKSTASICAINGDVIRDLLLDDKHSPKAQFVTETKIFDAWRLVFKDKDYREKTFGADFVKANLVRGFINKISHEVCECEKEGLYIAIR